MVPVALWLHKCLLKKKLRGQICLVNCVLRTESSVRKKLGKFQDKWNGEAHSLLLLSQLPLCHCLWPQSCDLLWLMEKSVSRHALYHAQVEALRGIEGFCQTICS